MLVSIEMNAIHSAGGCHFGSIEKMTAEIGADCPVRIAETGTPLLGAREFRRENSLRRANGRRTHNQNRGYRHTRLYRRLSYFIH